MCGIAGFSVSDDDFKTLDRRRLAAELLLEIEIRGRHATGAAWTQTNDKKQIETWYAKRQGPASVFLPSLTHVPRRTRTVLLHTRYATQGSPAKAVNNHPISVPGVVGVHNGHISNDRQIIDMTGGERDGEVDSEAAFRLIASSENVIQDLPMLGGRAALAWINTSNPKGLHLARIVGSPLAIGQTTGGSLIFASTKDLLANACKSAKIKMDFLTEVDEMTYLRVMQGVIHEFQPMGSPVRQGSLF